MTLCLSCVYTKGVNVGLDDLIAKDNILYLRTLGIGYCLGYDIEKLYDSLEHWFLVEDSERYKVINEIKAYIDTAKTTFSKYREGYDESAELFNKCFFIFYSYEYKDEIMRIAKKYCSERGETKFCMSKDDCRYILSCERLKHLKID